MDRKAAVLFADGFEEIEAVAPVDILRRAGVETAMAGVGGTEVSGSHGIRLRADIPIEELRAESLDLLVLPGGMPGSKHLGVSAAARRAAETVLRKGGIVAAICAAPVYTLSAWGLLSGRRATCYPGMEDQFAKDVVFSPDPVVRDGNVVTSRGAGTALDFSLALVAALFDDSTARELAAKVVKISDSQQNF